MLEAKSVSFRYGDRRPWVLHDFSMVIKPGEIVGLSGASGMGKTTLAKVLAGYIVPHHGQVHIHHQSLAQKGFCPVQLIFQHPELALNPRWSVGQSLDEAGSVSSEMLTRFNIDLSWLKRYPHELSGGELQRIAIVRALRPGARFLICDEITAMLDAITQAQIWQALCLYAREHQLGILVISHNSALTERLCERAIQIR